MVPWTIPLDYVQESVHGLLALYGHVVKSCNFWIPQVGGGGGGQTGEEVTYTVQG